MTLLALSLFLIPIIFGAWIVHLLWPEPETFLLKLSLGAGVGLGLLSLLYFLFLIFFAGHSGFFVIVSALFLASMASIKDWRSFLPHFQFPKFSWARVLSFLVLTIVTVLAAGTFINYTIWRPHGGFDAWLIWNRASRFIFRGGIDWKNAFSEDFYFFFHADYPLLIPLNNAWAWDFLNNETLRVPFMQAAIYLFGSAFLLFASLNYMRSFSQACLAASILLGTNAFLDIGAAQIADIALALSILGFTASLYLYLQTDKIGLLVLTGFFSGLSAWTKNEGLTFVLFSSTACLWILFTKKEHKNKLIGYLAGFALPISAVLYFKLILAPTNDLFNSGISSTLAWLAEPARYKVILEALLGEIRSFGGWSYLIPMFILYYFFMRTKKFENPCWARVISLILLLQIMGYLAVYLITPYSVQFHVSHSLGRILLHIYPAALFLLFSSTIAPEELFTFRKN